MVLLEKLGKKEIVQKEIEMNVESLKRHYLQPYEMSVWVIVARRDALLALGINWPETAKYKIVIVIALTGLCAQVRFFPPVIL